MNGRIPLIVQTQRIPAPECNMGENVKRGMIFAFLIDGVGLRHFPEPLTQALVPGARGRHAGSESHSAGKFHSNVMCSGACVGPMRSIEKTNTARLGVGTITPALSPPSRFSRLRSECRTCGGHATPACRDDGDREQLSSPCS